MGIVTQDHEPGFFIEIAGAGIGGRGEEGKAFRHLGLGMGEQRRAYTGAEGARAHEKLGENSGLGLECEEAEDFGVANSKGDRPTGEFALDAPAQVGRARHGRRADARQAGTFVPDGSDRILVGRDRLAQYESGQEA